MPQAPALSVASITTTAPAPAAPVAEKIKRPADPSPATHAPDAAELLRHIARRPGISLHELAGAVWPSLPWAGRESATGRAWSWPTPSGGAERLTAAEWLRDRLEELAVRGVVRHAPRRRDEVDPLASLSYHAPRAELPRVADALEALACGRREVFHG